VITAERLLAAYYFDLERIDYAIAIKTEDIDKLSAQRAELERNICKLKERLSDAD
jgi:cell division protein FtsB